jgi:hypothetical protein
MNDEIPAPPPIAVLHSTFIIRPSFIIHPPLPSMLTSLTVSGSCTPGMESPFLTTMSVAVITTRSFLKRVFFMMLSPGLSAQTLQQINDERGT